MPLQNINVVNASLSLTAAASLDYSTLLIVDCNHLTFDRATVYTSPDDYSTTVPSGTKLRKALDSAFSATSRPPQVVVGKSKGTATLTPTGVVDGAVYDFTITVLDDETEAVSFTAGAAETAEDVCVGWLADITANTNITDHVTAAVVGTGADAVLTITLVTGDDDYTLTSLTDNITVTAVASEAAADSITGIREINKDWTWISSTDHTDTYQVAMAAQALVYQKPYVTSTSNAKAYAAWDGVSTPDTSDIPARFAESNNNYAHCIYHHLADDFIECVRVTEFTNVKPGRDDFNYKQLAGFGLAQISDLSRPLNGTELNNLEQKYASTVVKLGGVSVIAGNRVSTGIRLEAIAFLNYARQELQRRADTLFLKMRKLGINDADLGLVRNAWTTWLDSNVSNGAGNSQALDPFRPYSIQLPKAKDVSFDDRVAGIVTGDIICYLDASIDSTVLNLTLTYRDPAEG